MNDTVGKKLRELAAAKAICSNNVNFYTRKKEMIEQELLQGINVGRNVRKRRELKVQLDKAKEAYIDAEGRYNGYSQALTDLLGVGTDLAALIG